MSGISSVVNFIVKGNTDCDYIHFLQGKEDKERGGLSRINRLLCSYKKWRTLLTQNRDVLIHYNFPLDCLSIFRDFFFMRYAVKKNIPMLIHLHGGAFLFKKNKPWAISKLLQIVFSWEVPFIVLSKKEKKVLMDEFRIKQIEVLPNCVDLSDAKDFIRENYTDSMLHILYLGRIEKNKGVDYILKASEILEKEHATVVIHFAGKDQTGGEYIRQIQTLNKRNNMVYEGIVFGKQKTELLKKCHVFLLPSFYEGLPISLLEGMSFGEVPIVTDVGSISEVICDRKNGWIVDVKSSEPIVDVIKGLANDRNLLETMSKDAQKTIFENFSPEYYMLRLNSIYDHIMKYN